MLKGFVFFLFLLLAGCSKSVNSPAPKDLKVYYITITNPHIEDNWYSLPAIIDENSQVFLYTSHLSRYDLFYFFGNYDCSYPAEEGVINLNSCENAGQIYLKGETSILFKVIK